MRVAIPTILMTGAIVVFHATLVSGECSTNADISKVFVVRRRLKYAPFKVCELAHSALILHTSDDKECVLEYLKDSKAHLYDAKPYFTSPGCTEQLSWWRKLLRGNHCYYRMKDDTGKSYTWTRQKLGNGFPAAAGHVSPQMAQKRMQGIMGHSYDFLRNNCHMAQEKLRQSWGLVVNEPYISPAAICDCGQKVEAVPGFSSIKRLFDKIQTECAKIAHSF